MLCVVERKGRLSLPLESVQSHHEKLECRVKEMGKGKPSLLMEGSQGSVQSLVRVRKTLYFAKRKVNTTG